MRGYGCHTSYFDFATPMFLGMDLVPRLCRLTERDIVTSRLYYDRRGAWMRDRLACVQATWLVLPTELCLMI
ncbi:uncharacterized protein PG998_002837 [Apiospora kogelbergensis]|uniref:uncharacterized protein n=1 Tax=Apiospora kogelbergensis TaxID=1337665 RepID=UPI00312EDD38